MVTYTFEYEVVSDQDTSRLSGHKQIVAEDLEAALSVFNEYRLSAQHLGISVILVSTWVTPYPETPSPSIKEEKLKTYTFSFMVEKEVSLYGTDYSSRVKQTDKLIPEGWERICHDFGRMVDYPTLHARTVYGTGQIVAADNDKYSAGVKLLQKLSQKPLSIPDKLSIEFVEIPARYKCKVIISKYFSIAAPSEAEARQVAANQIPKGWKVYK